MISVVEAPSSFIIFSLQLLCSLKRDGKEEQNDFYICSVKAQAELGLYLLRLFRFKLYERVGGLIISALAYGYWCIVGED